MKPTKGRIVLVTTPQNIINGQSEHAAIVTQVWGDDEEPAINVMAMPGTGSPFSIGSVIAEGKRHPDAPNSPFWRWPPRE